MLDDTTNHDRRGDDPVDVLTAQVIAKLRSRAPDLVLTKADMGKLRAALEERVLLMLCQARLARLG